LRPRPRRLANVDGVNPSTVLSIATGNTFDQSTTHDALGRVLTQTTPDDSVTHYGYDAGSRLTTVDVDIRGVGTLTTFVSNIEYNARGQRTLVAWREETDAGPPTEDRLVTERDSVSGNTAATMQDLTYSRDRVGNITGITDGAQDTLYFDNTTVTSDQTFEYEGLYRLIAATGREKDNLGQPGAAYSGGCPTSPLRICPHQPYTLFQGRHMPNLSAAARVVYIACHFGCAGSNSRMQQDDLARNEPSSANTTDAPATGSLKHRGNATYTPRGGHSHRAKVEKDGVSFDVASRPGTTHQGSSWRSNPNCA